MTLDVRLGAHSPASCNFLRDMLNFTVSIDLDSCSLANLTITIIIILAGEGRGRDD